MLCGRLACSLQALIDHPTPASLAAWLHGSLPPPRVSQLFRTLTLSSFRDAAALPQPGADGAKRRGEREADASVGETGPQPSPQKRARTDACDEAAPDDAWRPLQALTWSGVAQSFADGHIAQPHPRSPIPAPFPPVTGPPQLALAPLWRAPLGACVDASPLLLLPASSSAAWRCVVGSHSGSLLCAEFQSGAGHRRLWEARLGEAGPACRLEAAAAALPDGRHVAVGCSEGVLTLLRLADGGVAARLRLGSGGAIKAAPAFAPWDGALWLGTHAKELFCVSVQLSGDIPTLSIRFCCAMPGCSSAPAAFDPRLRRVYLGLLDGTLLAISCAGASTAEAWRASAGAAVFGTPLVTPEGRIVLACADGDLRCFADDGRPIWRASVGGGPLFASPTLAVDGESLFLGSHDGRLLCVRLGAGDVRWALPVGGRVAAAVCAGLGAVGGWQLLVCAVASPGEVVVVAAPQEGVAGAPRVVGRCRMPGELFSAPVAHAGVVLVGCRDDCLHALSVRVAD
jgi:acyl-CoA synthetase